MTSDGSGLSSAESFAEYDPSTFSWRTSQVFLDGDSEMFSETWPPSGTTRNGKAFQRVPLVPRTSGIASGFSPGIEDEDEKAMWPTPTAVQRPNEGNVRLLRARVMSGEMTEDEAIAILGKSPFEAQGKIPALWPTPTAHPHGPDLAKAKRREESRNQIGADDLATAVHRAEIAARELLPTPVASDSACGRRNTARKQEWTSHTGTTLSDWTVIEAKKQAGLLIEPSGLLGTLDGEESSATAMPLSVHSGSYSGSLVEAGGQLNPEWVEWLMGFPIGWTE